MKKIAIAVMTLCFAVSANAFAGTKHHVKHHAKKAVISAPASAAPAAK